MFPFAGKIICGLGEGNVNGYRQDYMPYATELAKATEANAQETESSLAIKFPGEEATFSMLALKSAWLYTAAAVAESTTAYLRIGEYAEHLGEAKPFFFELFINGRWICQSKVCRTMPDGHGTHVVKLELTEGVNDIIVFGWQNCTLMLEPATAEEYETEAASTASLCVEEYPLEGTCERKVFAHRIRNGVETMDSVFYERYLEEMCHCGADEIAAVHKKYPILAYWDWAAEKALREIPCTKVAAGRVVGWHLYNMGYVFKTATCCFGIDVNHRLAWKFADILDFILVTHNHGDHRSIPLFNEMKRRGKKVVTNFFAADGYMRPPRRFNFGEITVETEETDHNATLQKFMAVYRITCGDGGPVIYHTGDTCAHEQLHPSGPTDIWIVHPRVGLDVAKGAEFLKPKEIWFSHLWEMGHCVNSIYRPVDAWEVEEDLQKIHKTQPNIIGKIPFWGEKIQLAISN